MTVVRPKLKLEVPIGHVGGTVLFNQLAPAPGKAAMWVRNGMIVQITFQPVARIPWKEQDETLKLYEIDLKKCKSIDCDAASEAAHYAYCYNCWWAMDPRNTKNGK